MVKTQEMALLVEENLLQKRAVVSSQEKFVSRLFLVSGKDRTSRPVINLKSHFKMEGTRMIKDALQAEDWMSSLYLKDNIIIINTVFSEKNSRLEQFVY